MLTANLVAFALRGSVKVAGFDALGRRAAADWLSQAPVTYPLVGALAGLLSAACWFHLSRDR